MTAKSFFGEGALVDRMFSNAGMDDFKNVWAVDKDAAARRRLFYMCCWEER